MDNDYQLHLIIEEFEKLKRKQQEQYENLLNMFLAMSQMNKQSFEKFIKEALNEE